MKVWLLSFFILASAQAKEANSFMTTEEADHKVVLLNHGVGALEARLQLVESARESIDVEYFIYNLDTSGRIFTQALIKKAQEGVKVRILLDYFMASAKNELNPFVAHELEKYGIEVKYFNVKSALNLFSGQRRNHRKLLLIDGKVAITGGRNLGDEYFDLAKDFNFLDRDLQVEGPIVSHIKATFDKFWTTRVSKRVEREKKPEQDLNNDSNSNNYEMLLEQYNQKVRTAVDFVSRDSSELKKIREHGKYQLGLAYTGNCEKMSFNSNYATIETLPPSTRIVKNDLTNRIKNARESVLFDSTYFIVDKDLEHALATALEKNVDIRFLTNSLYSSDAIYVVSAFYGIVKKWISKGIDPYIFKGTLPEDYPTINQDIARGRFGIHAKSFVFDNKDVVIGTFNFDPRSANLNNEMTIACDNNPELAKNVKEDIDKKMKSSIHLHSDKAADDAQFYNTGFFKKIGFYLMKYPSIMFADYL